MRMITNLVIPLLLSGLSSTAEQGTHNSLVGGSNPSGRNLVVSWPRIPRYLVSVF